MNIVRRPNTTTETRPTLVEWEPLRMMRDMMRWDPFGELAPVLGAERTAFIPDVDIKETPESFVFKADLPGFKEKDVELSLAGNRLTMTGKREEERREEKASYFCTERSWGAFTRSFTLPSGTDPDHVRADLKDGVLTITLPKRPDAQAKKILVGAPVEKHKA